MTSFSILMVIFGICVFFVGLYAFRGHKIQLLSWKTAYKNLTKSEWKNIGKWTMIVSIIPFILAIIGFFLDI